MTTATFNPKSKIQNPKPGCIIFAGGGSGGHISPGLAIAERLIELAPEMQSIFVCSQRMIDASMLTEAGAEFVAIPATPPSMRPLAASRFLLNFRKSKRMVSALIQERGVTQAIALGGFIAAPTVAAAKAAGVPVMLVNLDAPPGKANLWMAQRCDEVISAIALPMKPGFTREVVGMPIRRRALAPSDRASCRAQLGLDPNTPTLLITGASQGATSINLFMIELAQRDPDMFRGWQIYHLSGGGVGAEEPIRAAYLRAGIRAIVEPFLSEIGLAWGAADLAISRAGASSVAEAAANAVPTLFLPYPYHKDMHQKHNVQPLVDLGGAVVAIDKIDARENLQKIAPLLRDLMRDNDKRAKMRQAMQRHGFPDAAQIIAQMLVERMAFQRNP